MGVRPAGSIAKSALDKSAEVFEEMYPDTAEQLKNGSYVDDLGVVEETMEALRQRTQEADEILDHAGIKVHKWIYSRESAGSIELGNYTDKLMADETELEKVLGIKWNAEKDVFRFHVTINLNLLKRKERTGLPLSRLMLLHSPPDMLTRRIYYSQVQALFDPMGFLAPVLLTGRLLLRKTWEDPCDRLGWDDNLPQVLREEIVQFFINLYELE